jgi:hypothetical protein
MRKILLIMLLLSGACYPSYATVSLTQSNSAQNASVTSQAVTLSGSLAAGDLILIAGRWGHTGDTITASDGPGTTYSHVSGSPISDSNVSTPDLCFLMWGVLSSSQSSLTVTVSVTGGVNHRLIVAAFDYNSTTGWAASQPETQSATNSGGTTNTVGTTGNVTTANTDLIFATINTDTADGGSESVTGGFTIQLAGGSSGNGYASVNRAFGGDIQNAAPGTYACTFHWTTSANFGMIIAAFKPSTTTTPTCNPIALLGVGCV